METFDSLAAKRCKPIRKGESALREEEKKTLADALGRGWRVEGGRSLEKEFGFRNFREALDFTNRIGAVAEDQDHHPDIALSWGKVGIVLWTHSVGGLSENDFILAAKVESLPQRDGN